MSLPCAAFRAQAQKVKYQDKAEKDKERYAEEMKSYKAGDAGGDDEAEEEGEDEEDE